MTTSPALALPELPKLPKMNSHRAGDLLTRTRVLGYIEAMNAMATYGQQCAQAQGEADAAEIERLRAALMKLEYAASFAGVPDKYEHRNLGIALEAARAALKSEAA